MTFLVDPNKKWDCWFCFSTHNLDPFLVFTSYFSEASFRKKKQTNYLHQIFFHWNWKRLQKVPRKWKEISILFLIFPCNDFRLKVPTKGWIWIFKRIFNWFSNIAWASKLKSLKWFVNWRPRKSKETFKNICIIFRVF